MTSEMLWGCSIRDVQLFFFHINSRREYRKLMNSLSVPLASSYLVRDYSVNFK